MSDVDSPSVSVESSSVSVVCALYNGAKFVRDGIASIAAQTLLPIELIVVDDGSTDESVQLVESLVVPFPVKVVRQRNRGQSAARNTGVAHASGKLVAFIDQDDVWYPRHLELLSEQFKDNGKVAWAFCNLDHVDESGRYVSFGMFEQLRVMHPKTNLLDILGRDVFVLPSASVLDREAFNVVGGFDENLSGYEDDDLFLRIFRKGYRSAYVDEALAAWRIHSGSASYSMRMDRSRMIYAAKLIAEFPNNPKLQQWWVRDVIAPRFYLDAHNRYLIGLEEENWERCTNAYEDLLFLAPLLKQGYRSVTRALKLALMKNPKVVHKFYSSWFSLNLHRKDSQSAPPTVTRLEAVHQLRNSDSSVAAAR